jgi:hypothetical protein
MRDCNVRLILVDLSNELINDGIVSDTSISGREVDMKHSPLSTTCSTAAGEIHAIVSSNSSVIRCIVIRVVVVVIPIVLAVT